MATKLNWEYQDRSRVPEYRADYKGLVIRAIHDDSPSNPFEDWDGHWPMEVRVERSHTTTYDKHKGHAVGAAIYRFTDAQLIHDQKALADILDTDPNTFCEVDQEERRWWTDAEFLRDVFIRASEELSVYERLDRWAKLYGLLGIPCLHATSTGYSQGDYADLLIVATPEAQKEFGIEPDNIMESLETQAKLYGAWAWGDVYGYVICRPDEEGEIDDDDQLDSCWGYYGSDFDWSGLEDAAIDAADGILETERRERQAKLKALLKAHAPLDVRQRELA